MNKFTQNRIKKNEKKPSLERKLLEKSFYRANKEVSKFPTLKPVQLGKYLYSKGFKSEGKKLFKENLDGKTFILLMTSAEGVNILEEELEFSLESIDHLKQLYKSIFLFRKKFCENFDQNEQPFY